MAPVETASPAGSLAATDELTGCATALRRSLLPLQRSGFSPRSACPHDFCGNGAILVAMKILVRWLLLAAALLLVAYLYPGVAITSFGSAMIAAFVIGVFNTLLRPILVLLTLPVTLLTLGLFLFVINALMFWWAGSMFAGFKVASFGAALLGSLIYSLCSMVIDSAMERLFSRGH